jgi:hypothetical protein
VNYLYIASQKYDRIQWVIKSKNKAKIIFLQITITFTNYNPLSNFAFGHHSSPNFEFKNLPSIKIIRKKYAPLLNRMIKLTFNSHLNFQNTHKDQDHFVCRLLHLGTIMCIAFCFTSCNIFLFLEK